MRQKLNNGGLRGSQSDFYVPLDQYQSWIDGLLSQGIDRKDAVETLKVGVRQLRGAPVFAPTHP